MKVHVCGIEARLRADLQHGGLGPENRPNDRSRYR